MTDKEHLSKRYERIYHQLQALLTETKNKVARMATAVAVVHHKMPHFSWTGFYILDQGELIVGPYQGPLACQVLKKKKGVCWAGVERKETIVVPDVHKFPGHIVCDSRTNSEIVVPLFNPDDQVWGILDVDSRKLDAFSDLDRDWLERIAKLI